MATRVNVDVSVSVNRKRSRFGASGLSRAVRDMIAARMLASGESYASVAARHNVTQQAVRYWVWHYRHNKQPCAKLANKPRASVSAMRGTVADLRATRRHMIDSAVKDAIANAESAFDKIAEPAARKLALDTGNLVTYAQILAAVRA